MNKELQKKIEKVKKHYLVNDIDDEEYQDNLDKITEWENDLRNSENFTEWQNHDVSAVIINKLKEVYAENTKTLGTVEVLSEDERKKIWSVQNSIDWLLSLINKDNNNVIDQIDNEIDKAIELID